MKSIFACLLSPVLGALLVFATTPTMGAVVLFSAEDITDLGGQDLWSYTFSVSGVATDETLDIAFDPAVHGPLEVVASTPGWFTSIAPSDIALAADGHVSLLNANDSTSLPGIFDVRVVRFVPGPAGAVTFEHYDGLFNTLGTGISAPIPEPASWTLLLIGLGLVGSIASAARRAKATRGALRCPSARLPRLARGG